MEITQTLIEALSSKIYEDTSKAYHTEIEKIRKEIVRKNETMLDAFKQNFADKQRDVKELLVNTKMLCDKHGLPEYINQELFLEQFGPELMTERLINKLVDDEAESIGLVAPNWVKIKREVIVELHKSHSCEVVIEKVTKKFTV